MLQSFVEKDENNMVDYNVSSRFLGDMIKRFFSPALLQKKAKTNKINYFLFFFIYKFFSKNEFKPQNKF